MTAYQDMVFSTAVRLLGNESEAQDIAQEVFIKAHERFAELSSSPTAGGWLRTVARNMSLNHLTRYRSRWRFFSEMTPAGEEEDHPVELPGEEDVAMDVEHADRRVWLERCLERLPASQRVPLVLYHFEEMSYEEIAARLGISLAKVKTDIFRARDALRRVLRLAVEEDEASLAAGGSGGAVSRHLSAAPLGGHSLSPDWG